MLLLLIFAMLGDREWAEGWRGLGGGQGWGCSLSLCSLAGSPAQNSEFSLKVEQVVTVQEGLCVLVPCTLTYPKKSWTENTPAYGYWFKEVNWRTTGLLVATNNQSQKVQTNTKDRFQLVGSPQNYKCSLLIRDVQWEDKAMYYFRVERGSYARYDFKNYRFRLNVQGRELA